MKYTLDYKEYSKISRQVVSEGCLLLKNENQVLPIKKNQILAIFGRIQFHYYKSGTGSGGMVNTPYTIGILEGLKNSKQIRINKELEQEYRTWLKDNPFDMGHGWAMEPWCQKEMPLNDAMVEKSSQQSDVAIIIIGRTAGEDQDNSATKGSYLLSEGEENMLLQVTKYFDKVVVILNVGNIIDMKWVDKYKPQAVLYGWQGGSEGGNGIADIITGKVSPSGKLSDTIAYDITDYPSTNHFGNEIRNYYCEDIYVGYRFFETFAQEKVLYPFGFGLSYTTFTSDILSFEATQNSIAIKIKVTNTGSFSGKEVIQVYYNPSQGELGKPIRNLVRFSKTKTLKPNEFQELFFHFPISEMASYDDGDYTGHKNSYVLERGNYEIYLGTDVKTAELCGNVIINNLKVIELLSEAMSPTKDFDRLKPKLESNNRFRAISVKVPIRTVDLSKRMKDNTPLSSGYTGDQGYQLIDVAKDKIPMLLFLEQLSDDELICLTRGEGMCSPKVTGGTAGSFGGVTERLLHYGIPIACCADGPSGIRMDCGTTAFSLPNGTCLASTFNTDLVEELYTFQGKELRKNNIDSILGPGINIHRNPLNGRNFEYFSEDPYLTGMMAVAELKGMSPYKVTGTIKHFACNNQEFKRNDCDSHVSERALREIYLKPFELAVKQGNAISVMTSYGSINGLWAAGNYDLLTTILRKEWKFDGIVMTDWWAKINSEGSVATKENTTAMIKAQNDIYMVTQNSLENSGKDNSKKGLCQGKLSRGELLRTAQNIGYTLIKLLTFDREINQVIDEISECNVIETQDHNTFTEERVVLIDKISLNVTHIKVIKGASIVFPLKIVNKGDYRITILMSSFGRELSQIPVTLLINNHFVKTITINGTGEHTKTIDFVSYTAIENYLTFYFGEGGLDILSIIIDRI